MYFFIFLTMQHEANGNDTTVFVSEQFFVLPFKESPDMHFRYDLTFKPDHPDSNPQDFNFPAYETWLESHPFSSFENYRSALKNHVYEYVSPDKRHEFPVGNLYYFPKGVRFIDFHRYQCSKNVTLVYDTKFDRWGIGYDF